MWQPIIAYSIPFGIAFVASIALTPLAGRLARRLGLVTKPRDDRWNPRSVPLLGGTGIWTATLIAVGVTGVWTPTIWWLMVSGTLLFAFGLVDDVKSLKPATKLTAQIAVACLIVASGWSLDWTNSATVNALLTILWFVGITNAFNLLDNMDGVCAGVALICAIAYGLGPGGARAELPAYAAALAGACAGFLVYNFQPASIFLGDSGSLFLGSAFAVLTIVGEPSARTGIVSTLVIPALVLLLPIYDTVFVTLTRKLSARSASVGGRDHTSHRLVALGFSERETALLLYALAAAGGAVAVMLRFAHLEGIAVAGVLVVGVTLLAVFLSRISVYDGQDFALLKDRRYTPLLFEVTYKRRVFEVLLDFALIAVAYYSAYVTRFDVDFAANYPLFVQSLPLVIGCHLISFFVVGVYRGVWRYVSVSDLTTYAKGIVLGGLTSVMAVVTIYRFNGYSRSVFIISALFLGVLMIGTRASFRALAELASRHGPLRRRAVVYGAGDRGALLVREVRNNRRYEYRICGFIDDDPAKQARRILGVPVLGTLERLQAAVAQKEVDVVIVSTAKIPAERLVILREWCYVGGVQLLILRFELERIETGEFSPQRFRR
jgi:UDP-GlcNAc:undecaprenyl-phosphate GlcNAc-1-phosphate transferase